MKKIYILLILSTVFSFHSFSQEITMETGVSFTSFEFKNSQGNELDNLLPTTKNFISLAYRQNVLKDILHLVGGLSLNQYGAVGSDDSVNLYYQWDTSYLGVFIGVDIKVFKTNKMTFYLRGTTASEFILQGTQTLNNQVINLKKLDYFNNPTFFFRAGAIIEYHVSETFSIFTQYKYGKSSENGKSEKLKYKSHDIGLGLVVKLFTNSTSEDNNK